MLSFEALMTGNKRQKLSHLFVLEESHIMATQTAASEEIMTIDRMVGQIIERGLSTARFKGVGYILTDQQPGTRLMFRVMANTNMKIYHNLLGKDAGLMSLVMGLSSDNALNLLGVGEAYVKLGDANPL